MLGFKVLPLARLGRHSKVHSERFRVDPGQTKPTTPLMSSPPSTRGGLFPVRGCGALSFGVGQA